MIKRAERWLESSGDALRARRYDDATYCAQMCVEQASKAVLVLLGVEYPKVHDVSDVLRAVEGKMPKWFKEKLNQMCFILTDLAKRRSLAGYGFEKGLDVSYFADIAPRALEQAKFVFENCRKFVEDFKK